jgi:uncharacterized protein involved in response to NO
LLGAIGVLLWPLFLLGATTTYPAVAHARLMIEGMMSCFVFGFLGTAGPRLMSVPHFSRSVILSLIALITLATIGHLLAFHAAADALFVVAMLIFVASLGRRFRKREDSPPPNFALVGLGIVNGVVGGALLLWSEATSSAPTLYRLGASFLNIGFILLPLLGVAPFFLRRLLDLPMNLNQERGRAGRLALAVAVGLTVDASFVLELFGANAAIGWVRCLGAAAYVVFTLPWRRSNLLAAMLRMSMSAIIAGLALLALLPAYRLSALHVVFIGGFSMAVFAVATRVVLGHSGRIDLLRRRRWPIIATIVLLILAMISRFAGDFVATRNEHLIGGALGWLLAAIVWSVFVLPHVFEAEAE